MELHGMQLTIDAFFEQLPTYDRPIFAERYGGFIIPSRLHLGSYPGSYKDATCALARHVGWLLADDAGHALRYYPVRTCGEAR